MLFVILRSIDAIEIVYIPMYLSDTNHIPISQIIVDSFGQPSHKQVILETLQQDVMRTLIQR